MEYEILGETRDRVGESPVWSVREQALYWVDIEGRAIRRMDWSTRAVRSWQVAERIGCIALRAGGGCHPRALRAGGIPLPRARSAGGRDYFAGAGSLRAMSHCTCTCSPATLMAR